MLSEEVVLKKVTMFVFFIVKTKHQDVTNLRNMGNRKDGKRESQTGPSLIVLSKTNVHSEDTHVLLL